MQPTPMKGLVLDYITRCGASSRSTLMLNIPGADGDTVSNALNTLKRNGFVQVNSGKYGLPVDSIQSRVNSRVWNANVFA